MNDRLKPFLAQLKDERIPAKGILSMANGGKNKGLPPVTEDDVKAARAELAKAAEAVSKGADAVTELAGAVAHAAKGAPEVSNAAGVVAEVAKVVGDAAKDLTGADTPAEVVGAVIDAVSDLGALAAREAAEAKHKADEAERNAHALAANEDDDKDRAYRLDQCRAALAYIAATKLSDTDHGPLVERIRAVQALLAAPVQAQPAIQVHVDGAAMARALEHALGEHDAEPPSHVRVIAGGHQTFPRGPAGRPLAISFRGVHKGDEAAWLWKHHRALVEPFDPTPRLPRK